MSNAITVTLSGKKSLDISDSLVSMRVEYALNKIPYAELLISDGNFADRTYPIFDAPDLQLGSELDIKIRYEGTGDKDSSIFKGVVVSSSFGISNGLPTLTILLKDPAFRLENAYKTELFAKVTSRNMIETVMKDSTGVSLKKANAALSSVNYDQYVRKQSSGLEFIMSQLRSYGLVAQWENGALQALSLNETTGGDRLELGITEIVDLDLKQDGEGLNKTVDIAYWDVKKNATMTVKKSTTLPAATAVKAPNASYVLLNLTDKKMAEGVVEFLTTQEILSNISGTITVPGNPGWKLMQKATLVSFPKVYNGDHAVSSVLHELKFGTWTTSIGLGFSSIRDELMDAQLSPTNDQFTHLEFAEALKWEKDPLGLGRIPVKILAFGKDKYWAFPSQVAAGSKQCSYLLPEANEQLIIGFLNGNYSQGFVVTSTFLGSAKPPAPFKLDAKTPVGFLSTSGMKLIYTDDKTSVEFSTPGSSTQTMSKDGGIEFKTSKDFKANATGKLEGVAKSKMTLKGATIDLN